MGKVWETQLVRQAATGLKLTTVDPDTFAFVSIENRMFIFAKLKEQVKQLRTAATAVSETRDQRGHLVVPCSAGPAARCSAAGRESGGSEPNLTKDTKSPVLLLRQ